MEKRVIDIWFACRQMQQSILAMLLWQYGLKKLFKILTHSLFWFIMIRNKDKYFAVG